MKIVVDWPPNIRAIKNVIPYESMGRAVFCYGDTIFNPHGLPIDECVGYHEAQHFVQQEDAGGVDIWWERWLSDPKFRVEQELEAYGFQFRRFCELYKDRNRQTRELYRLASDLCSPQYGSAISQSEALQRIRGYVFAPLKN